MPAETAGPDRIQRGRGPSHDIIPASTDSGRAPLKVVATGESSWDLADHDRYRAKNYDIKQALDHSLGSGHGG
jgi:hypothetical protein